MKTLRWLGALSLLCGLSTAETALAAPATVRGHVVELRTGWGQDTFAVVTDTPIANPFGCLSPDGYIAFKTDAGYDTYFAAAQLALTEQVLVEVVFDDASCKADRPQILGLNLLR